MKKEDESNPVSPSAAVRLPEAGKGNPSAEAIHPGLCPEM